ncbi:MAG: hypothetical protein A2X45_24275 [Lentisphaerae bacterium GWF2_50_93]|nr:MAG: hypothetical protein A2X45_24275 [Lentisphaerae bacterium GWF2_50_93]
MKWLFIMVLLAGGFLAYQAFPDAPAPQAQDATKKKSTRPLLEPKGVPPSNPQAAADTQPKTLIETPYLLKEIDSTTLLYKYGPVEATLKKGRECSGRFVFVSVCPHKLDSIEELNRVDIMQGYSPAETHFLQFIDLDTYNRLTNNGKASCHKEANEKAMLIEALAGTPQVLETLNLKPEEVGVTLKGFYATVTSSTFKGKPLLMGNAADAQAKKDSKPEIHLIITELKLIPAKK